MDNARPAAEVGFRAVPHLRPPSISHGVASFIWGALLGLFIWSGMLAIGISGATSFIVGAVGGFGIFLYVRVYGADEPRPRARRGAERAR